MKFAPTFTDDTMVLGLLAAIIGFVFYTSAKQTGFWSKFYKIVPSLLMVYFLPALLNTFNIISPNWITENELGEIIKHKSGVYNMAKNYLLPASLVLMSLSVDLKAILNLGPKALIMFFTATVGVVIGGPIAIMILSVVSPETIGGADFDAVWRGMSTIAGSWIGGGANQAAMLEIYQYNPEKYGAMVFIDIVIGNIWTAVLFIGIGKSVKIDKWLKSDTSAIENLKQKTAEYVAKVERTATSTDLMVMLGIAFAAVGFSHFAAGHITSFLSANIEMINDPTSFLSFMNSKFFWMVSIATLIGVLLSFTKVKQYEGAGASKYGSVFIHILVATIGMKADLGMLLDNPGLLAIGIIWISVHIVLLVAVAKWIRAPYFFLAVGSQANIGGAASAPVVAAAFHPSLASVGVLLAVFGYVVGTFSAIFCTELMRIASGM
ncbi:MAG: DUF819 family protein [Flavobacteriaceae bacterium]|nr:DUF819 family protein [Flavobacteriaceae bacterium]